MALNSLFCADVPLSNYSLTRWDISEGYSKLLDQSSWKHKLWRWTVWLEMAM